MSSVDAPNLETSGRRDGGADRCKPCVSEMSGNIEHMPWYAPLFNESMEIRDGMIDIPSRPGSGFSFNAEAIRRFELVH